MRPTSGSILHSRPSHSQIISMPMDEQKEDELIDLRHVAEMHVRRDRLESIHRGEPDLQSVVSVRLPPVLRGALRSAQAASPSVPACRSQGSDGSNLPKSGPWLQFR